MGDVELGAISNSEYIERSTTQIHNMNYFTSFLVLIPFMVGGGGALTKANVEVNKPSAISTTAALVLAPRTETHYGPAF